MINYGIASTGTIVPRFVRGLQQTSNGKALAICSRSKEKGEQFAKDLDIPLVHDDYRKMLENDDIDAIYVPLPNSLHYQYAKEALLAGKHVVVEKPFVLYGWQGQELKELSRERGLFIVEAIKTPYLPLFKAIREIVDDKRYGKLHLMQFRQSYVNSKYNTGWNKQKEYGGGVLYGNEAYFYCMAEFLGGKIVSYSGMPSYGEYDVEDQCSLSVLLENDILAHNMVSTKVLLQNGLFMYFDKARIDIPDYWKAREAYIYQDDKLVETLSFPCEYELFYEAQYFNDCIEKDMLTSDVTPIDNSIRYAMICEDLHKMWRSLEDF